MLPRRLAIRLAAVLALVVALTAAWRLNEHHTASFPPVAAPQPVVTQTPPRHADVVVFSPHPDDEVLGTGGAIQQALARGESVAVVYFTYGEGYGKSVVDEAAGDRRPADYLRLAETRQREALRALGRLGLPPSAAIFLGYPDTGLGRVAGDTGSTPVRSPFTTQAATWGPYVRDFHSTVTGHPAPYTRASALGDVTTLMRRLRPSVVYTTAKADMHPDHEAAFDLVLAAAQATHFRGRFLTFIVHGPKPLVWPWPRGPAYGSTFDLRHNALPAGVVWPPPLQVPLTPAQFRVKSAALEEDASQMGMPYERSYLSSFLKGQEIFWPVHVTGS